MKIAFVAYDRPNWFPGPLVHLRRLLPALRQRGSEPLALLFCRRGAQGAGWFESQGVPCRTAPERWSTEAKVYWLLEQVRRWEPDVLVSYVCVPAHFAGRWCREAGIPTIGAMLADDPYHWGIVEQFVTGSSEWALSGLACVSNLLVQAVADRSPQVTRLYRIPHGTLPPPEPTAGVHPPRLLYIGRMQQYQKRIHNVVDALAEILRRLPVAQAMLIGSGPLEAEVQAWVRSTGLADRMRFVGGVPEHRIQELLQGGTVIVLLSDFEGIPIAIADGMAAGVVPVCRRCPGGLEELVRDNQTGLLADSDAEVVERVCRLLTDHQQWHELSQRARRHAVAEYSMEVSVKRWEEFCESFLSAAGTRRRIQIPESIALPPVLPALAAEDVRHRPIWIRAARKLKYLMGA